MRSTNRPQTLIAGFGLELLPPASTHSSSLTGHPLVAHGYGGYRGWGPSMASHPTALPASRPSSRLPAAARFAALCAAAVDDIAGTDRRLYEFRYQPSGGHQASSTSWPSRPQTPSALPRCPLGPYPARPGFAWLSARRGERLGDRCGPKIEELVSTWPSRGSDSGRALVLAEFSASRDEMPPLR